MRVECISESYCSLVSQIEYGKLMCLGAIEMLNLHSSGGAFSRR